MKFMSRFFCFTVVIFRGRVRVHSEHTLFSRLLILPMPLARHQQKRGNRTSAWGSIPYKGSTMSTSTGPRTPRGKARSSQNAAKHWVESRRILPEELEEAAILRSGFEEDLKPEGLIEHEIIDDLTLNRVLRRRIDMAFTREFSTATSEKEIELRENRERSVARYWLRLANVLGRDSAEFAERLRPDDCIPPLRGLVGRIGDRGPQPEDLALLQAIYGDEPTKYAAIAMRLLAEVEAVQTAKDEAVAATSRKELEKKILDVLQTEIKRQENREEQEIIRTVTKFASALQEPLQHALETLLRYRVANAREFSGLLDSLERIRRLRRNAA